MRKTGNRSSSLLWRCLLTQNSSQGLTLATLAVSVLVANNAVSIYIRATRTATHAVRSVGLEYTSLGSFELDC